MVIKQKGLVHLVLVLDQWPLYSLTGILHLQYMETIPQELLLLPVLLAMELNDA